MTTRLRTIRLAVVAVAVTALMAPAAQARPIGLPVPMLRTNPPAGARTYPPVGSSILKNKLELPPSVIKASTASRAPTATASGSGFNWTDAFIGAIFATVLVGLGVSGIQMGHRRAAHV